MTLDENKYNELFIENFKVNPGQLLSEFKRVINEYGYTEEVKLAFYLQLFNTVITQLKRELPENQQRHYIISTLYEPERRNHWH